MYVSKTRIDGNDRNCMNVTGRHTGLPESLITVAHLTPSHAIILACGALSLKLCFSHGFRVFKVDISPSS